VVLLVAIIGAGGLFLYYKRLDSSVRRTDAFLATQGLRAAKAPGQAQNILLLGSDSRNSDNPNYKPKPGDVHTDTIVLMHIDAAREKAYLISIPRDLYVYVPRSVSHPKYGDTKTKINAAFAWGGLPLTIQTIEQYTGVRIDHVVQINFEGFKKVADALGGVDLNNGQEFTSIAEPRYRHFAKGMIHLDGAAALDYVRQRKQFLNGDYTRMCHQRQFLRALLDKATSTGTLSNPRKLDAFLTSAAGAVTVDKDFSLADAALQFRKIGSRDLTSLVIPTLGTQTIDDQSVILSDDAKARILFEAVVNDRVADWVAGNVPGREENQQAPCT
jgi:LCP family protein required for cell wall assembly